MISFEREWSCVLVLRVFLSQTEAIHLQYARIDSVYPLARVLVRSLAAESDDKIKYIPHIVGCEQQVHSFHLRYLLPGNGSGKLAAEVEK